MRIIDRYMATAFLKSTFAGAAGLAAFMVMQNLKMDMSNPAFSYGQLLYFHFLLFPQLMVQMMPPAVLLGTVITLAGLSRTSELVAIFSIGIGRGRIAALFISVTFILCCFLLVVQDRVLPGFYRARTTFFWREIKKRPDFFLDFQQDKIWYRSRNLIYNLRRFEPRTRTIYGMSVYSFDDDFRLVQLLDAERADYLPQGWKLKNGTVTVFSRDEQFPMIQEFKEKDLQIAETPSDFKEIEREVEALRIKEFYHYIRSMQAAGADTKGFEVKFHARLSLSFMAIIMCLIALPFSIHSRRETGAAKDYAICFFLAFLYWLLFSISLSLGNNGSLPPVVAAWFPGIFFLSGAAIIYFRARRAQTE